MNLLHFVREMRDKIVNGGGESEPVQWGDIEGKPTSFDPSSHTHTVSEITGLEDRLTSIEQRLEALENVEE